MRLLKQHTLICGAVELQLPTKQSSLQIVLPMSGTKPSISFWDTGTHHPQRQPTEQFLVEHSCDRLLGNWLNCYEAHNFIDLLYGFTTSTFFFFLYWLMLSVQEQGYRPSLEAYIVLSDGFRWQRVLLTFVSLITYCYFLKNATPFDFASQ